MDLDLAGRMRKLLEAFPYDCNIASLTPEVFLLYYNANQFIICW